MEIVQEYKSKSSLLNSLASLFTTNADFKETAINIAVLLSSAWEGHCRPGAMSQPTQRQGFEV